MHLLENFKEMSKNIKCDVVYDEPMSSYTSFKTGGKADIIVSPESCDDILKIVDFCRENGTKPLVVGNGSNLLVRDEGYKGVVIHIGKNFEEIKLTDECIIECLSGTSLMKLCRFAYDNELSGLEFAYGIPGTVGGAAYMNAGAYGGEVKDVIFKCEHINSDGTLSSYSGDELEFSYRTSAYKDSDKIITKVYFKLNKGNKTEIKEKMDDFMQRRKSKQPLEYPSAGSTFKRPEGYFADKLIEDCGLKGVNVGGAEVSQKHSGFIINKGDATSSDILKLIRLVQDVVLSETGVFLETEVKII